jgi:hypothetical protein
MERPQEARQRRLARARELQEACRRRLASSLASVDATGLAGVATPAAATTAVSVASPDATAIPAVATHAAATAPVPAAAVSTPMLPGAAGAMAAAPRDYGLVVTSGGGVDLAAMTAPRPQAPPPPAASWAGFRLLDSAGPASAGAAETESETVAADGGRNSPARVAAAGGGAATPEVDDVILVVKPACTVCHEAGLGTSRCMLSPQQVALVAAAEGGNNLCVLGSAGTGKSLWLKHVVSRLRATNHVVAVTAMTGIAAVAVAGSTLHSFAGIGLGTEDPERILAKIRGNRQHTRRYHQTDVLVIDEIRFGGLGGQLAAAAGPRGGCLRQKKYRCLLLIN